MDITYLVINTSGDVIKQYDVSGSFVPQIGDLVELGNNLYSVKYRKLSYKNNKETIKVIVE